jgi:hypothetical protein
MTYVESVKEGFRLVHRNWQLLLIQLTMILVSTLGFFTIIGIPLAIAFLIFGIDLTGFSNFRDIFRMLKEPSGLLSRYLGLIIMVIVSLLVYIIIVTVLGIFVFGGSIGIIGRSVTNRSFRFSLNTFFNDAKKLFFRIFGFTAVVGIILIITAFIVGILGGSIAALVSFTKDRDSVIALFLGTFLSLFLTLTAAVLILSILSMTMYGVALLLFKGTGSLKSLQESLRYLTKHPDAFWLYTIIFTGYIFISFFLIFISYSFTLIPLLGTLLSFPYQLISNVFQTYLGLVIVATTFNYYYSTEMLNKPAFESPLHQSAVPEEATVQDS